MLQFNLNFNSNRRIVLLILKYFIYNVNINGFCLPEREELELNNNNNNNIYFLILYSKKNLLEILI